MNSTSCETFKFPLFFPQRIWFSFDLISTVSVTMATSVSRFFWPTVSLTPSQHGHEASRSIWLQAAESAYRFTLGSIAGGEWHVCRWDPCPPRGNFSRAEWCCEAPGAGHCAAGRGAVMWGSSIVLLCHRWLQAVVGDGALEWHKSSGTALPGISV